MQQHQEGAASLFLGAAPVASTSSTVLEKAAGNGWFPSIRSKQHGKQHGSVADVLSCSNLASSSAAAYYCLSCSWLVLL
jgi:hypothetical protein